MHKKVLLWGVLFAAWAFPAFAEPLVIADFDSGDAVSNLSQPMEVWMKDNGADKTQSAAMSFAGDDALGAENGKSLRLDYDVDSPNPAYNGWRTSLRGADASGYQTLEFYIKGDSEKGFGQKLKIEMIQTGRPPSPFIYDGITDEWQLVSIPLETFFAVKNWADMHQFVIVFADIINDPKEGAIYIDQIQFKK